MIRFACSKCMAIHEVDDGLAGAEIYCEKCNKGVRVPKLGAKRPASVRMSEPAYDSVEIVADAPTNSSPRIDAEPVSASREKNTHEKYCSECASIIRSIAEICPKCGVRQPVALFILSEKVATIKAATIAAGIFNLLASLVLVSTCVLAVLAPIYILTGIMEISFTSGIDSADIKQTRRRALGYGIWEIVIGILVWPTLICGIVNVIQSTRRD